MFPWLWPTSLFIIGETWELFQTSLFLFYCHLNFLVSFYVNRYSSLTERILQTKQHIPKNLNFASKQCFVVLGGMAIGRWLSCPGKDRRSIAVRCWDPLPLQCKHVQHSCCVWCITDCAALMWSCYCHSVYLSTNSVNCCLLHCCGPSCHLYLSASTCSFLSPRLHHVACLLHIQWLSQGNTAYSMHFLCLYF